MRHEVWRRDQGRCVDCGSRERLELDHVIPISKGGSNTARNLELRCETCNRRKGATIWDDRDEMGIFIEPPEYVAGLQAFEQWV